LYRLIIAPAWRRSTGPSVRDGRSFFERPILNSPYEVPKLHHALDDDGQPLDLPPVEGRRRSELITPVPKPRKSKGKKKGKQDRFVFGDEEGLSTPEQEYNPTPVINEIRSHVASWRDVPNPNDWGVTPAGKRQNHRHGDVDRMANSQCRPLADEQSLQPQLSHRYAGDHDPRPAAGPAA
jgi:type III restriction enzyme